MSDLDELKAEWFEFGRKSGKQEEQTRIIKLLEVYFRPEEAKAIYPADYEQYLDIVALIKREK